ncbi:hypothetical protein BKM04_14450 [Pseudomonas syringae pv. syringae]|nr:hypothetical protein BKM04_14450 [Pseudomonas syringae pv. syringae]POD61048.1 hypothetical protein BKM06_15915 [Pseudomonas syringae pv. syringae]
MRASSSVSYRPKAALCEGQQSANSSHLLAVESVLDFPVCIRILVCADYSRSTSQELQPLPVLVFAYNAGFDRCFAKRLSRIFTTEPRERTMLQLDWAG